MVNDVGLIYELQLHDLLLESDKHYCRHYRFRTKV